MLSAAYGGSTTVPGMAAVRAWALRVHERGVTAWPSAISRPRTTGSASTGSSRPAGPCWMRSRALVSGTGLIRSRCAASGRVSRTSPPTRFCILLVSRLGGSLQRSLLLPEALPRPGRVGAEHQRPRPCAPPRSRANVSVEADVAQLFLGGGRGTQPAVSAGEQRYRSSRRASRRSTRITSARCYQRGGAFLCTREAVCRLPTKHGGARAPLSMWRLAPCASGCRTSTLTAERGRRG